MLKRLRRRYKNHRAWGGWLKRSDNKDQLASATADGKEGNPAPFTHLVTVNCTPISLLQDHRPQMEPRQRMLHWLAWRVRILGEGLASWFEGLA